MLFCFRKARKCFARLMAITALLLGVRLHYVALMGDFFRHYKIRAAFRTHVVLDRIHQRTNEKDSKAADARFVHAPGLYAFQTRPASEVANPHGQPVRSGFASDLYLLAAFGVLNAIRARLGDREFDVFDVFDGEVLPVRNGRHR